MLAEGWVNFGPVSCVSLSPNGESILSIGNDDGIIAESSTKFIKSPKSPKDNIDQLNAITEHELAEIHGKSITAFTRGFSSDSIIFIAEDGIFSLNWNTMKSENLFETTENYKSIEKSESGYLVVLQREEENKAEIFHKEQGHIGSIQTENAIEAFKISNTGKYIALYEEQNGITIFETQTQNSVQNLKMSCTQTSMAWTNDDKLFVCDSYNKMSIIILTPATNGQETMTVSSHDEPLAAVSLAHDNNIVTLSTKENKIVYSSYEKINDSYETTLISTEKFHRDDGENDTQEEINAPYFFDFISDDLFCIGEEFGKLTLWRFGAMHEGTKETQDIELESDNEKEPTKMIKKKKEHAKEFAELTKTRKKSAKKILDAKGKVVETVNVDSDAEYSGSEGIPLEELGKGEEETDSEEEDTDPMLDKTVTEANVPKMISSEESSSDEYERMMKQKELDERRRKGRKEKFDQLIVEESSSYSSSVSDDDFVTTDKELTAKQKQEELRKFTEKRSKEIKAEEEEEEMEKMINDGEDLNASAESASESYSQSDYSDEPEERKIFMPGSSFDYDGNRKFLCWNKTAAIYLRLIDEEEGRTAIDIEFHDKYLHRDVHMDNEKHFVLATVNENGFAGASRTTVNYRFNKVDGSDAEFKYAFKGETIDLIAIGNRWVAAYTSHRILRIFSTSGLEIATLSMPATPVTMVGSNDLLFVVYGDKLQYTLFNIYKRTKVSTGIIPCQPPLKWAGFDEDDNVYAFGSDMILQELVHRYGYHWTPVCNIRFMLINGMNYEEDEVKVDSDSDLEGLDLDSKPKDNDSDFHVEKQDEIQYTSFWCVYVSGGKLFGVPLKDETMPRPSPLPSLFEIPVAPLTIDKGAQSFMEASYRIANATTKDKKEQLKIKRDTIVLKCFTNALRDKDEIHALEYAKSIYDSSAQSVALMYAKNYCEENNEDTELADRIQLIFDQKNEEEEENEEEDNELFGSGREKVASSTESATENDSVPPQSQGASDEQEEKPEEKEEPVKEEEDRQEVEEPAKEEEDRHEEEEEKKEKEEDNKEEEESEEYEDSIVEEE